MYGQVTNLLSELIPAVGGEGEELNLSGLIAVFTAKALPSNATHAWVCNKGVGVYVTFDGTDPNAIISTGFLLEQYRNDIWSKEMLAAARFSKDAGKLRIEPLTRRG